MITIGYARVSSLLQVSQGNGLDVQREQIAAWCAYAKLPVPAIEADEGISGASTDNRPAFKRAIRAALEAPQGTAVFIVYKLDRLGRNALDVQETLAVLLDAGVRVVSLSDGVDSGSGMGAAVLKLLTGILATFAELERDNIRSRMTDGKRLAKASGRIYTCEAPYGMARPDPSSKAIVVDEKEAAAVARIHALRASGLSYQQICLALAEEGIAPRRAAIWYPITVQRICTGKRSPAKAKRTDRVKSARAAYLNE